MARSYHNHLNSILSDDSGSNKETVKNSQDTIDDVENVQQDDLNIKFEENADSDVSDAQSTNNTVNTQSADSNCPLIISIIKRDFEVLPACRNTAITDETLEFYHNCYLISITNSRGVDSWEVKRETKKSIHSYLITLGELNILKSYLLQILGYDEDNQKKYNMRIESHLPNSTFIYEGLEVGGIDCNEITLIFSTPLVLSFPDSTYAEALNTENCELKLRLVAVRKGSESSYRIEKLGHDLVVKERAKSGLFERITTLVNGFSHKQVQTGGEIQTSMIDAISSSTRRLPTQSALNLKLNSRITKHFKLNSFGQYTRMSCPLKCGHNLKNLGVYCIVLHPDDFGVETDQYKSSIKILELLNKVVSKAFDGVTKDNLNELLTDVEEKAGVKVASIKSFLKTYLKVIIKATINHYNCNHDTTALRESDSCLFEMIDKDDDDNVDKKNIEASEKIQGFDDDRIRNWVILPMGEYTKENLNVLQPWTVSKGVDEVKDSKQYANFIALMCVLNFYINPQLKRNEEILSTFLEKVKNFEAFVVRSAIIDSNVIILGCSITNDMVKVCCPQCCTELPSNFSDYEECLSIQYFGNTEAGKTVLIAAESTEPDSSAQGVSRFYNDFGEKESGYQSITTGLQNGQYPRGTKPWMHIPLLQTVYNLPNSRGLEIKYLVLTVDMPGESCNMMRSCGGSMAYVQNLLDYENLRLNVNSTEEKDRPKDNFFVTLLEETYDQQNRITVNTNITKDLHWVFSRIDEYPLWLNTKIVALNDKYVELIENCVSKEQYSIQSLSKLGFNYTFELIEVMIDTFYERVEDLSKYKTGDESLGAMLPKLSRNEGGNYLDLIKEAFKDYQDVQKLKDETTLRKLYDIVLELEPKTTNEFDCKYIILPYLASLINMPLCFINLMTYLVNYFKLIIKCFNSNVAWLNLRCYAVSATGYTKLESKLSNPKPKLNLNFVKEARTMMHATSYCYLKALREGSSEENLQQNGIAQIKSDIQDKSLTSKSLDAILEEVERSSHKPHGNMKLEDVLNALELKLSKIKEKCDCKPESFIIPPTKPDSFDSSVGKETVNESNPDSFKVPAVKQSSSKSRTNEKTFNDNIRIL